MNESVELKPKAYASFIIIAGGIIAVFLLFIPKVPIAIGIVIAILAIGVYISVGTITLNLNMISLRFNLVGYSKKIPTSQLSAFTIHKLADPGSENFFTIVIYDDNDRKIIISNKNYNEADMDKAELFLRTHFPKKLLD